MRPLIQVAKVPSRAAVLITSAEPDAVTGVGGCESLGGGWRAPDSYLRALGGAVAVPGSGKRDGMSFACPGKL